MSTIYLPKRKTALEIRDPLVEACVEVAGSRGLFAVFRQPQQPAFDGNSGMQKSARKRIGNGIHKSWYVDYREEPPRIDERKCHVLGTLVIKSHFDEASRQYGGWDYGKFDPRDPNYAPTYNVVNLSTIDPGSTWNGMGAWLPHVLEPELLEMSAVAIRKVLVPQDPLPFDNFGNF